MSEDSKIPREFVFQGRRWRNGKTSYAISVIVDGELTPTGLWPAKALSGKAIGGVYAGVSFSPDGSTGAGFNLAKFERRWRDDAALVEWQALDADAAVDINRKAAEAKIKRDDYAMTCLRPLRAHYQKMSRYHRKAFEDYILTVLREPV